MYSVIHIKIASQRLKTREEKSHVTKGSNLTRRCFFTSTPLVPKYRWVWKLQCKELGEKGVGGKIGERNKYIPYDPVLEALHVTGDHFVDFRPPGWQFRFIYGKCIDGLLTEVPNVVDGPLQAEIVILHEDDNHVVRIASRLFDII